MPPRLAARGISQANFYSNITYWLDIWMRINPDEFAGWSPTVANPFQLATDIYDRIVAPTRAAGALFRDFPYLTRLYTTLSPVEMTRDPVFSENPFLPPVSNVHEGTLKFYCGGRPLSPSTPARLVTEQGWTIDYPRGVFASNTPPSLPGTRRLEALSDEGPPRTLVDNDEAIAALLQGPPVVPDAGVADARIPDASLPLPADASPPPAAMGGGGCAVGGRPRPALLLALLAVIFARRASAGPRRGGR